MPAPARALFIVESDIAVRNLRRMMMSYLGWTVRTFSSCGECLQAILHQVPTCIVADLSPPTTNALELQAALISRKLVVPIVAVTDFLTPSLVMTARAAGIAAILDSPCDAQRLESAIQRVLKKKAATSCERRLRHCTFVILQNRRRKETHRQL